MTQRTRDDARPSGDAWPCVRRELSEVAGFISAQVQRWQLSPVPCCATTLASAATSPTVSCSNTGLDPMSAASAWDRFPVIDKQWLARAGYHRQPACDGPVLIVATSGSTATQVLVPVTAECANRGLGDNFLRALAMSGVGPGQRHWGIEHRPAGHGQGHTGSEVSMTWLARHCGDHALVTAATEPLAEQLRRAAAFGPDTISGSPGFLRKSRRARGPAPCARYSWCTAGRYWPIPTPPCCGRASRRPGSPPSTPRPTREPWAPRPPARRLPYVHRDAPDRGARRRRPPRARR